MENWIVSKGEYQSYYKQMVKLIKNKINTSNEVKSGVGLNHHDLHLNPKKVLQAG